MLTFTPMCPRTVVLLCGEAGQNPRPEPINIGFRVQEKQPNTTFFTTKHLFLTGTFESIPSEARFALALEGPSSVKAVCVVAALVGVCCTLVVVWKHKEAN